jgi:hypothetical protein
MLLIPEPRIFTASKADPVPEVMAIVASEPALPAGASPTAAVPFVLLK